MKNRTRLIVTLMFAAVIILAAAITRFYVDSPDEDSGGSDRDAIVRIVDTDSSGYSIFAGENDLLGIAEADKITAPAEWLELSFAGNGKCIACTKIGGVVRTGCVDYEGNVVVPLVYSGIERISAGGVTLYTASAADGSVVVYDESFIPKFSRAWLSCTVDGDEFVFADEKGEYRYSAVLGDLLFKSASVSGKAAECPYKLDVYSRVLLSRLTPLMIETMADKAADYIVYAFSGENELPGSLTPGASQNFSAVFPGSEEIVRKRPVNIKEIHLYATGMENGIRRYEVSTDVEIEMTYTDEENVLRLHKGIYKAAVLFSADSEGSVTALSGSFDAETPDYPVRSDAPENGQQYASGNNYEDNYIE